MNMKDIISYADIKTILNQDVNFLDIENYESITSLKKISTSASDCKYALFGYALELLSLNDVIDIIAQNRNDNCTAVINYLKEFLDSDRYIKPDTLIRDKYLIKVYWGDNDNTKSYADFANIEAEARTIWYEYFSEVDTYDFVNNDFLSKENNIHSIARSFLCINDELPAMLSSNIALYSLLINNTLEGLNSSQKDLLTRLYPDREPLKLWNYRYIFLEFLDALSKRTIHY